MKQANNKTAIQQLFTRQPANYLAILMGFWLVALSIVISHQAKAESWYKDNIDPPPLHSYDGETYHYFTKYYQQVHEHVLAGTATTQELWDYNILLRKQNARDFLKLELTPEQAIAKADDLLYQAYRDRFPAAVLQMAYKNIEVGIGQPIYEYIDGEYYPVYFKDANIKSVEHLKIGLAEIIELLKVTPKNECYADYNPEMTYPYFDISPNTHPKMFHRGLNSIPNNRHAEYRVIESFELRIGNVLDKLSRRSVTDYPDIQRQLDLISLRNKVHCKSDYYNLTIIGGYLMGQSIDEILDYDYSAMLMPTDMDNYHEQLFLSVFSELMGRPEFIPVFASRVSDVDKAKFVKDRAELLHDYYEVFGE